MLALDGPLQQFMDVGLWYTFCSVIDIPLPQLGKISYFFLKLSFSFLVAKNN